MPTSRPRLGRMFSTIVIHSWLGSRKTRRIRTLNLTQKAPARCQARAGKIRIPDRPQRHRAVWTPPRSHRSRRQQGKPQKLDYLYLAPQNTRMRVMCINPIGDACKSTDATGGNFLDIGKLVSCSQRRFEFRGREPGEVQWAKASGWRYLTEG